MGTPVSPTLAGFLAFLQNVVGITLGSPPGVASNQLPVGSPYPPMAFAVALAIVNPALACVAVPSADAAGVALNAGGLTIYALAAYNLAASNLFNYAQDPVGAPIVPGSTEPDGTGGLAYFAFARKRWNINGFTSGVVESSSDQGTSVGLVVQEAAKNFTLQNLSQLKDPYGRQYLAFAQSFGPTTWGIS